MILDKTFCLSDAQELSASGASTNVLDLNPARLDGVIANPFNIRGRVTAVTGTGGTIKVELQTSDVEAFTAGAKTITVDEVTLSDKGDFKLCADRKALRRYIRLYYTLDTFTAATVTVDGGTIGGDRNGNPEI